MFTKDQISLVTLWLNRISLVLGTLISIAFVYLALPTILGFILGVLCALANAYIMWIISDNALNVKITNSNTLLKYLYIFFATSSAVLSSISVFFHTQGSIILLAPFLSLTIPLFGVTLLSYTLAILFSASIFLFSFMQLNRRWQQLQGIQETNIISNNKLRSFALHFSNLTNILGTLITIGHVWAAGGSPINLGLGIFLSLCDLAVLFIFNHQLLSPSQNNIKSNSISNISKFSYISGCVVSIIGSKIGSFIVHYTGTLLLGAALGLSLPISLTAAILISSIATVSGFLFSSTQAYNIWDKLTKNDTENKDDKEINAYAPIHHLEKNPKPHLDPAYNTPSPSFNSGEKNIRFFSPSKQALNDEEFLLNKLMSDIPLDRPNKGNCNP